MVGVAHVESVVVGVARVESAVMGVVVWRNGVVDVFGSCCMNCER